MELTKEEKDKFTHDFYRAVIAHKDPEISLIEGEKVLLNILYSIGLKEAVQTYEWFKRYAKKEIVKKPKRSDPSRHN